MLALGVRVVFMVMEGMVLLLRLMFTLLTLLLLPTPFSLLLAVLLPRSERAPPLKLLTTRSPPLGIGEVPATCEAPLSSRTASVTTGGEGPPLVKDTAATL